MNCKKCCETELFYMAKPKHIFIHKYNMTRALTNML